MVRRRAGTVLAAAAIAFLLGAGLPAVGRVAVRVGSVVATPAAFAGTTTTVTTSTVPAATTTSPAAGNAGSQSVISLGRTGQAVFIGAVIGVFVALWFGLILYDRISANRRLDRALPELLRDVQRRDTDKPFTTEQIKAITYAIKEAPRGAPGLTRTTLAFGLLTLVGIALVALLVGIGSNASDLLKAVVTALTTALTTVVGFYFGAKTATDAASFAGGGASAATPGPTKPGPPGNVLAEGGDQEATISFDAPVSTGGSPITGYTVTSVKGATPPVTAFGDKSPIVVPKLVNGVEYTFTVHATNAIGNGPESSESKPVTPQAKSST